VPDVLHFLLLRHGQTDSNASGVLQGHLPTPLNELGHRQAERLALRLAEYTPPVGALVTSDLRRALETTAPIERALGLTAEQDPGWRERAFGSFEGRTVGDTEIWRAATGTIDPPGAEAIGALEARVAEAFARTVARHQHCRTVAVVTHGGVMRSMLRLLGDGRIPVVDGHDAVEVGPILNASILHLSVERSLATRCRVVRLNDVDHLAAVDATALDAG
jgi:probable phosphoglycerate mutase